LPEKFYTNTPQRKNSRGFDLGNLYHLTQLETALHNPSLRSKTEAIQEKCPSNDEIEHALASAPEAYPVWSKTPIQERASILEKAADLIEQHRDEAIALCVYEAGKILADAIAEVREAADFCRYYASLLRMQFTEHPLQGPTGE